MCMLAITPAGIKSAPAIIRSQPTALRPLQNRTLNDAGQKSSSGKPRFWIVGAYGQTGSNSAVLVLERIGGADIATSSGHARSAQCSAPGIRSSGVLDFCLPLLQVDVDRTSNQFCDRRPL